MWKLGKIANRKGQKWRICTCTVRLALYMCGIFFKETKFAGILGEMHEKFRRRSMV